ncbi:MAG TPA: ClbS/DfsB family four-helix bundle protein [Anaerolineae bacterium]
MIKLNHIDFISKIEQEYANLTRLLERVPLSDYSVVDIAGHWTLKDIIGHITWFEREMIGVITTRVFSGSDWWLLPQNERNARIYEQNRDRQPSEVLADAQQTHLAFMQCVLSLDDDDLINPQKFKSMPPEWIPWDVMAGNSFRHYRDHANDIEAWLKQREIPK